jgi:hypothetical protein
MEKNVTSNVIQNITLAYEKNNYMSFSTVLGAILTLYANG